MFKESLTKELERAFYRDFYTSLSDVTLVREATDSVYNPVTETYTGGTNGLNESFKGMFRKYKKRLVDGVNIYNGDVKLTVPQSWITFTPTRNDIIDGVWRVVEVDEDTTKVFHNMQLRRIQP